MNHESIKKDNLSQSVLDTKVIQGGLLTNNLNNTIL